MHGLGFNISDQVHVGGLKHSKRVFVGNSAMRDSRSASGTLRIVLASGLEVTCSRSSAHTIV